MRERKVESEVGGVLRAEGEGGTLRMDLRKNSQKNFGTKLRLT